LVAVVVLACVAGLLVNQRIRRDGLVVDRIRTDPSFTPNGDGHDDTAGISFRIKGPDRVDLEVLDSSGDVVRHLLVGQPMENHKVGHYVWDGNADGGAPAPAGSYTLRIHEIDRDRTITPPNETIVLVRTP
jgi:flagellar hook assembly protein FlgD